MHKRCSTHSIFYKQCFVYKQRFFQPVDFSEKNKQRTSWNQNVKQHPCNYLAMKLVTWSQIDNAGENLCKCNEILVNQSNFDHL